VEGVINEVLAADKEPKDVFSKIARAIGKRTSVQKKDWNEDAKRRDSRRNLIGSTNEMMERIQTRQSLRRYILDQNKDNQRLDPNKLVEYNPQLLDVSPAARVAYAKFKMRKIQEEFEKEQDEVPDQEPAKTFHQSIRASRHATTAFKVNILINSSDLK
jgi:transient receptor potential cation channel subfamily C